MAKEPGIFSEARAGQDKYAFRLAARARAESTLKHYLRTAFEASGRTWSRDNDIEVEGIVDDILVAAQ